MNKALATVVCALGVVIGCGGHGGTKKSAVDSGAGGADSATTNGDASRADATTGDACQTFTACGGDIVGKWRLNTGCPSEQASGWCAEFVAEDRSGMQMDYTFASDGTFTVSSSGTVRETFRMPFTCISSADAGAAQVCADVQNMAEASARATVLPEGFAGVTFNCSVDATGCLCEQAFALTALTKTGTYATRNAELIASFASDAAAPDAGVMAPTEYCVSGNTLAIHSYDGNGKAGTTWYVKN